VTNHTAKIEKMAKEENALFVQILGHFGNFAVI